jgi:hypothetical protein
MESLFLGTLPHLVFKWRFDHLAGAVAVGGRAFKRDTAMLALSEHHEPAELQDRLRDAPAVTAELLSDLIGETCRRFPSAGRSEKIARIERLIESAAWTDAALALIDLELPQWRLRRLAYDGGEWHCALSRQRELPAWLNQSIEARHADLPLAILGALVDAQATSAPSSRTSVPAVSRDAGQLCEPVLSDNFA